MKVHVFILLSAFLLASTSQVSQGSSGSGLAVSSDIAGGDLRASASTEFQNMLQSWIGGSDEKEAVKGDHPAGLFFYLTDHMQAERRGEGWHYRKNLLLDYQHYVMAEKEFSLKECKHGDDELSKAICNGKGAMLFHMLRENVGDGIFFDAVKSLIKENEYSRISWSDVRAAFENASGNNLEWFFSQWVDRKGLPEFEIEDERVAVVNGVQAVSFDIVQKGEAYRFDLPVIVRTDRGEVRQMLHLEKEKEHFALPVEGTPMELLFDSDYAVMRKLLPEESPPLLSGFLGDEKKLLVIPDEDSEKYRGFIDALKQTGFPVQGESEIKDEDIRSHSLLIFESEGRVVKRLFGNIRMPATGFTLSIRKNPLNASKVIAIAHADTKENIPSPEALQQSARYSRIRFSNGRYIERIADEAARGISVNVYEPVLTIQPAKLGRLEDDFDTILDKTIIYAGERHVNYEDHKTQLRIIMNLHERGHTFAIGMEMFQKPFQKDLDDYLSGALSEREFLKKTQYFKRWQFDYNLYREIIEYAKAKNIPVIALNLWTEIIKKVSTSGLDSLTDIERAELPASMDMSDEEYRKRLEDVFKQHRNHENKNFDNFYQSQILWDETMAQAIDEFLSKHPDYQMVVLAGAGHLMYGSGIPQRAYRLNKKDYVIILPGREFLDGNVADYLVTSEPLAPPTTLKLGVILNEHDGYVQIEKVVPGSIAKSTGLKKGDILVSLDDWKIEGIDDVKIFMLDKKRGEQFTIQVLRKKFLVGYREVVLEGTI